MRTYTSFGPPMRWISGNPTPDFRTIYNFRGQRLKHHIHDLFAEVAKMLQELQVLSFDIQYIDGRGCIV